MNTDHKYIPPAARFAYLSGLVAIVVASAVLLGWALDIAALKSVLPDRASMTANAAACFILIGLALWLTANQSGNHQSAIRSRLARLCELLVGLTGLLSLGEYVLGWDAGIDQLLFREAADADANHGRMSPETALNFVLFPAA